jgi:C_GCAxxG_C_C family probable redox protein
MPKAGTVDSVKQASANFARGSGFSCSQAVFSAFAPQLGLDRELALKIASAFGGGMARRGETCGAVTGALMVIGLKYGRTDVEDEQAKEQTYALAQRFVQMFTQRHGSIVCQELLDCDISIPQERELAHEQQLFSTLCSRFVQDAAEITAHILGGQAP